MEISILLLTYNHEKYIKYALDSIISQKISVSYEILILDDASTDNTQKILIDYKKQYPNLISLYLRRKNSCHPTRSGYFLLTKAKGRYFATIEGDDYWTDPLKIQKQYDFLEKNKQYSACVTDLIVVDEKNQQIPDMTVFVKKEDCTYTLDDLRNLRMHGMAVTFFSRNYSHKEDQSIIYKANRYMGDITLFMLCVTKLPIYQIDEKTAAYRYVSNAGENNFNSIHKENIYKRYMLLEYWIMLENYIKKYYMKEFELIPIKREFANDLYRYSFWAMLRLVWKSKNRKKYLSLFVAKRYLLNSQFVLRGEEKRLVCSKYSWIQFNMDNRPIVIFGAGNVAKEYIDKYAWKENILFLVDNDNTKQNKSFKGFIVKDPKEILKYNNRIKILIANRKYEEDIRKQLYNMGIEKCYCYCFMQSNRPRNVLANSILCKYMRDSE